MEDKDYKLECLMRSIKDVEMAKKMEPELYKKALSQLKLEVETIGSIADLRKVKAAKEMKEVEESEKEEDDGEE